MADAESSGGAPQYLESLSGDAAERITAMKWARYLGAAFGPSGALSALRYYARIDWISEDVKEDLLDFLAGFGEVEEAEALVPGTAELTRSHHTRSLSYINRLDDSDAESLVVDRWDEFSGGQDGV
jgi:flagellar protein FlaE/flagellar protein FlaC